MKSEHIWLGIRIVLYAIIFAAIASVLGGCTSVPSSNTASNTYNKFNKDNMINQYVMAHESVRVIIPKSMQYE